MKYSRVWSLIILLALVVAAAVPLSGVLAKPALAPDLSANLVISQVYGGGGNTGAQYKNDFVELFNLGATDFTVPAGGYSVQYSSSTGTTWSVTTIPAGTVIPAGEYFLVALAAGTSCSSLPCGADLPAADATGTSNMAGTNGKVALAAGTTALTGACPIGLIDFVGYGSANCYESAAVATLSNTTAALRKYNGCMERDTNNADFSVSAPAPRNSATAAYVCPADFPPMVDSHTPATGAAGVTTTADIVITFSEAVTVSDPWFTISCTSTGAHTAVVTPAGLTYTLNPDADFALGETCTVTVVATAVQDNDGVDPVNMAADDVWTFTTHAGSLFIHDIQGSGTTSPYSGFVATIQGIVTGDYQTGLSGYFLQEEDVDADADPLTSEGIFVYSTSAVNSGDLVQVTGTVTEYNGVTEITPTSAPVIGSSGNPLPAITTVTLPETTNGELERYEGMYVQVATPLTVVQNYYQGRYGQLTLSSDGRLYNPTNLYDAGSAEATAQAEHNALNLFFLDDGSTAQNPTPVPYYGGPLPTPLNVVRAGDLVTNLIGYLDEGLVNSGSTTDYRLHPSTLPGHAPVFTNLNVRPSAPADVLGTTGSLTIASSNTLNYFPTLDLGPDICGPAGNMECRGADSATEFTRQQDKLTEALCTVGADIVGLMEIENPFLGNDPDLADGVDDYVLLALTTALNADPTCIAAGITYDFTDNTFGGTDAIRQAIIFNPATVVPFGTPALLNLPAFVDPLGSGVDKNRPALAQTFEELSSGEFLTVVVNHLKSKGSDCLPADPDTGDGQGNCNLTREAAADYLVNTWLPTDPTSGGDPDFLIIGDMNAYAMEDPIQAVIDADYINLVKAFEGEEAYSYIFDGFSGYLDHALGNETLAAQVTGATEFHINADETPAIDFDQTYNKPGYYEDTMYRMSDHDIVVIGLDLGAITDVSDHAAPYGFAWAYASPSLYLGTIMGMGPDVVGAGSNDGVVQTPGVLWTPGGTGSLDVTITNPVLEVELIAWIDWNGDGDFDDEGETIFVEPPFFAPSADPQTHTLTFSIPATAPIAGGVASNFNARFRLYPSGTMMPASTGPGPGGEIEDYNYRFGVTSITLQSVAAKAASQPWLPVTLVLGLVLLGGVTILRRK